MQDCSYFAEEWQNIEHDMRRDGYWIFNKKFHGIRNGEHFTAKKFLDIV